MITLHLTNFMQNYNSKNDSMNESETKRVCNYSINPRDSKIYSDKRFVNIDNGEQGGTHCSAFYVKNNKS